MLPLVGIPGTIAKFLKSYRQVFCKEAGFQHISRYINGLVISPNKTLQGIYSQLVWNPTRCAMRFKLLRQGWVGDSDRRLELSRRILPSSEFGRSDKHRVGNGE